MTKRKEYLAPQTTRDTYESLLLLDPPINNIKEGSLGTLF